MSASTFQNHSLINSFVIGIDIGGTNTRIGLVNTLGEIVSDSRIDTPLFFSANLFLEALALEVDFFFKAGHKILGIGIGAPSVNLKSEMIENAANLNWEGPLAVTHFLKNRFQVPVAITNDANLMVLAHQYFGKIKYEHFVVVTLGTGVGSGICCNGMLLNGRDGFAGEVGHLIVEPLGRSCHCGRQGCLETYSSAKGIKRSIMMLMAQKYCSEDVFKDIKINELDTKVIAELASKGNQIAIEAFHLAGTMLGAALANFVVLFNPEIIFLTGGVTNAGSLLFGPTIEAFNQSLLNVYPEAIPIEQSVFGESEGAVLGAASLIWNTYDTTNN